MNKKPLEMQIGRVTFRTDDPASLGKFLREVGASPALLQALGDGPKTSGARESLLAVLRAVIASGEAGLPNEMMVQAAGLTSKRSLSATGRGWKRMLGEMGFRDYHKVLEPRRISGNERAWYPGPRAQEALDKLEAVLGDSQ